MSETRNVECISMLKMALTNPEEARAALPDYRLTRLVTARFELEPAELRIFAQFCGSDPEGLSTIDPAVFHDHLRAIVSNYGLRSLFQEDGPGRFHHIVRPSGYDYFNDRVSPLGMETWRADYRAMVPERQIMAATILWLYRAGKDSLWLRRVPCTWHAAHAIGILRSSNALSEWGRLVTLYPGW
jgi:hypothetical protein